MAADLSRCNYHYRLSVSGIRENRLRCRLVGQPDVRYPQGHRHVTNRQVSSSRRVLQKLSQSIGDLQNLSTGFRPPSVLPADHPGELCCTCSWPCSILRCVALAPLSGAYNSGPSLFARTHAYTSIIDEVGQSRESMTTSVVL